MIAGLVLAAGESSRMGRDKALLLYRGRTFLEAIVRTLDAGGIKRIAVVLGHHAEEIRQKTRLEGAEAVVNEHYRLGQTSSLQAGLAALDGPALEAVLVCLVDHPTVHAETVRALVGAFEPPILDVVIPSYGGERGHPVLIARQLFPELRALGPGIGANSIIRKYRDTTRILEVNDPGVVTDVDDPKTYQDLIR
ncbi:MAG: molybdenum cofactor cytidylyltransferase [Acidobacteria bacterium]|nr:MAG: molybdenum cofactor cytidylyltransferase [Acidobacteriota bacterium]